MKKSVLLALAALAMAGTPAVAQEVIFEPDCSQGILKNAAKDNWFITVQGGTNLLWNKGDNEAAWKDRFGGNAALFIGKWIDPNVGFRFGANWLMPKGATTADGMFRDYKHAAINNTYYPEKFMAIGPQFEGLVNLTNWWCGYRPGRVYNAVVHAGFGANFILTHQQKADGNWMWHNGHHTQFYGTAGLQNNFRLSQHVDFFIDVTYTVFKYATVNHDVAANIGFNFNLGKTTWDCPVTAVCPVWKYTDAEGDALVAKLNAAERKIGDLQAQLDACLKRPVQKVEKVQDCEGLATVYYPINQYGLSAREKTILKSVASVMQENPNKKYVLTGYADNYTGTDEINDRLRQQRVDGVRNYLVACGVDAAQLETKTDNANLTDYGVKAAPLDRAVTIRLAD
ncbi:MAG: OmpA family protein [Bacteroides sp.]|nr:OmpA family protein [Bacteroides sp.]